MHRNSWSGAALIVLLATAVPVGAQRPEAADDVLTKTVVVKGEGTDPEQAEVAAVLQAVHEVIGLYVDAKQHLKNDKVAEEILTFANGMIYSAERVKDAEKQSDGLWHVEMKVSVAVTELKDLLKKYNFKVTKVDGEKNAKRDEIDAKRKAYQEELDKKWALNLGKLLAQFSLARMLTPADEPHVESLGRGSYEVRFQLQPDLVQWTAYRLRLERALKQASADPQHFTVGPMEPEGGSNTAPDKTRSFTFMRQLDDHWYPGAKRLVNWMKQRNGVTAHPKNWRSCVRAGLLC